MVGLVDLGWDLEEGLEVGLEEYLLEATMVAGCFLEVTWEDWQVTQVVLEALVVIMVEALALEDLADPPTIMTMNLIKVGISTKILDVPSFTFPFTPHPLAHDLTFFTFSQQEHFVFVWSLKLIENDNFDGRNWLYVI